jgi:phosphoglycerol transferase MdoB-like AlkP superfamily enzyme
VWFGQIYLIFFIVFLLAFVKAGMFIGIAVFMLKFEILQGLSELVRTAWIVLIDLAVIEPVLFFGVRHLRQNGAAIKITVFFYYTFPVNIAFMRGGLVLFLIVVLLFFAEGIRDGGVGVFVAFLFVGHHR